MSEVSEWWNKEFMKYAAMIGSNYQKNPQEVLGSLKYDSVLSCLNESYQVLVRENCLFPIERIDEKKKKELWDKAKEIATGKQRRILVCKAIYLLEKITE